jgi:hypothetical protein
MAFLQSSNGSRFVRACLRQPVDRTPVWFLRQAGRYMPEYMAVRKHHTLLEICRTPRSPPRSPSPPPSASASTPPSSSPTSCCPSRPWASTSSSSPAKARSSTPHPHARAGPGAPHRPRTTNCSTSPRHRKRSPPTFRPARARRRQLGIIGFCGAPFTLASYMIEGGSSRNYIETKKLMYASRARPPAWPLLMEKLVTVLTRFARQQQVEAGADVIQIFDSWAGALSVETTASTASPPPPNSSAHPAPWASPSSTSASTPPRCCPPCARPAPTSSASTGAPRSTKAGAPRPRLRRAGQPRPHHALRPEEVLKPASPRSSRRPPAAPATSSTSATASSPERRSKMQAVVKFVREYSHPSPSPLIGGGRG